MSRAKGHHIVPQRYLKRFAKDGIIRVVPFGRDPRFESIKNAAKINDLYTAYNREGQPNDAFEHHLAQVEDSLFPAFGAVDSGWWPLDTTAREQLSLWIAVQYLRTQIMKQITVAVGTMLLDADMGQSQRQDFIDNLLAQFPDADPEPIRRVFDACRNDLEDYYTSTDWHIAGIVKYTEPIAASLQQRRWIRYDFQRKSLTTSDEPIGLTHPQLTRLGIGNAFAVTFPLGRRIGLAMLDETGYDQVRDATSSVARTLNRSIVNTARLALFHHPDDEPLRGLNISNRAGTGELDPETIRAAADGDGPSE